MRGLKHRDGAKTSWPMVAVTLVVGAITALLGTWLVKGGDALVPTAAVTSSVLTLSVTFLFFLLLTVVTAVVAWRESRHGSRNRHD